MLRLRLSSSCCPQPTVGLSTFIIVKEIRPPDVHDLVLQREVRSILPDEPPSLSLSERLVIAAQTKWLCPRSPGRCHIQVSTYSSISFPSGSRTCTLLERVRSAS
jgi:hypothetical protein